MIQITLYIIMSLLALVIIIALIWTKIISKNTFSPIYTSLLKTRNGKKMYMELLNKNVLKKIYSNSTFISNDISIQLISEVYIGYNYIYLISKSLSKDIKTIKNKNGNIIINSKTKNKKLTLNPEIELFIKSTKKFKKIFDVKDNLKVIIPILNKDFKNTKIDKINFVSVDKISDLITAYESQETTTIFTDQLSEIEAKIIVKNKHFFINIKSVYE
ncbi:MAG: hypothetical protein KFW07_02260 [Mycoplasmataceae bacterium]|nr:hypothetical protein [Mycoplasmataceae bacterium]